MDCEEILVAVESGNHQLVGGAGKTDVGDIPIGVHRDIYHLGFTVINVVAEHLHGGICLAGNRIFVFKFAGIVAILTLAVAKALVEREFEERHLRLVPFDETSTVLSLLKAKELSIPNSS